MKFVYHYHGMYKGISLDGIARFKTEITDYGSYQLLREKIYEELPENYRRDGDFSNIEIRSLSLLTVKDF